MGGCGASTTEAGPRSKAERALQQNLSDNDAFTALQLEGLCLAGLAEGSEAENA